MNIEVIEQRSDTWQGGVAYLHKGARVARRVRFADMDRPFYTVNNIKVEPGDWVIYEVGSDRRPEGKPTYARTEEAAIDVADAIAKGEWR